MESICIMPNLINIQIHIDTVRGNLQSLIVGNNGSRKRGPVESTVLQTNRKQESKKASQKARKQESKPESKKARKQARKQKRTYVLTPLETHAKKNYIGPIAGLHCFN